MENNFYEYMVNMNVILKVFFLSYDLKITLKCTLYNIAWLINQIAREKSSQVRTKVNSIKALRIKPCIQSKNSMPIKFKPQYPVSAPMGNCNIDTIVNIKLQKLRFSSNFSEYLLSSSSRLTRLKAW